MSPFFVVRGSATPPATLWVDSVLGDDSRSKATVAGSGGSLPWATVGRAAWGSTNRSSPNTDQAAAAGDIVSVAAGSYDYAGTINSRFGVVYNPANSGAADALITFRANGPVTFTGASAQAPAFGCSGRDYIVWDGFTLDEADWQSINDTGPALLHTTTGSIIRNCRLTGATAAWNSNHNGIRCEAANSFIVRNCLITGFRKTPDNHNGSGVTLYGCRSGLLERMTITDCGGGVFYKDTSGHQSQYGNVVRLNRISGCNEGVIYSVLSDEVQADRNFVYQNLILDGGIGINILGADNDWVYCNTVVGMTSAGLMIASGDDITGVRVWNNIYSACDRVYVGNSSTMRPANELNTEHAVAHAYTNFYQGTDGTRTLASFKGQYTDQDAASPATFEGDPLFVDGESGNYRLQGGSPARDHGRHPGTGATMHAGCYQTGDEQIGADL